MFLDKLFLECFDFLDPFSQRTFITRRHMHLHPLLFPQIHRLQRVAHKLEQIRVLAEQ